jgi:hypothetical protein
MLLIYTPGISNRLVYTMDHVFKEQFGIDYILTTNIREYLENKQPEKISYAAENPGDGAYFYANGLLSENNIKIINPGEGNSNGIPVLFSHNNNAALDFDVFAAVFYLLSRYEEYLGQPTHIHGNYDYKQSVLYKLNILDIPIVEQWIDLLKAVLKKRIPSLVFIDKQPRIVLTFDIDVAYAYKSRSLVRTIGGLAKKLIKINFKLFKDQLLTLFHSAEDPYDTYDYIFNKIKNFKAIFFFNMGAYGRYDKNPSYKNKKFQQLIQYVRTKAIVGLHPSYASNSNQKLISLEKSKLEKILNETVTGSRQHYLKLKMPDTFRQLIQNGINNEFTTGYYYTYGFRAGTCTSFLFFDLVKNKTTNMRLYPFAFMEGTLKDVLKMNIADAKQTVSKLINIVHEYKGIFIPLWHNSTLSDADDWSGWREVFEHMLRELEEKKFKNLFPE